MINFDEEKEFVDETVNVVCDIVDKVLKSGIINSVKNKQKICAVASFLEFIKAGANVTVETKKSDTVSFIINME